jgi:hypothetical protein
MSLPDELLQLAANLASLNYGTPTDAGLRRSISTAYYAVFHLMASAAADEVCNGIPSLRQAVQRQFDHAHMKKAAEGFAKGYASLPAHVQAVLQGPIPPQLMSIAQSFVDLQEARHRADYDSAFTITVMEASTAVSRAKQVFRDWTGELTANPTYTRVFLISLLLNLNRRS